eukprot:5033607-Amphidinium_carterae.1
MTSSGPHANHTFRKRSLIDLSSIKRQRVSEEGQSQDKGQHNGQPSRLITYAGRNGHMFCL